MTNHRCKCFMCSYTESEPRTQPQMTISTASTLKAVHRPVVYGPVGVDLPVYPCTGARQHARIVAARALQRADMGTVSGGGVA